MKLKELSYKKGSIVWYRGYLCQVIEVDHDDTDLVYLVEWLTNPDGFKLVLATEWCSQKQLNNFDSLEEATRFLQLEIIHNLA